MASLYVRDEDDPNTLVRPPMDHPSGFRATAQRELQAKADAGDPMAIRALAQNSKDGSQFGISTPQTRDGSYESQLGAPMTNRFSTSTPQSRGEPQSQARDDANFQQANENLARVMGRPMGLTDGAASTRGQAGTRTNVPPGAMRQPDRAMGNTYWDQNATGPNPVEQAGIISRQADEYQKALSGGNQEYLNKAEQDLVKAYNDSEQSTPNDVVSIKRDGQGGMQFIRKDGTAVNKTPVTADDLRNIGGSRLQGQNVFQRAPGGTQGQGMGMQPAQSKSAIKAAEMVGGADIKMMGDQVKALEKQLDITSDADRPALMARIDDAKAMQREAINQAGSSVYGAGMPAAGGQGAYNPAGKLQELIDQGLPDDRIKSSMWRMFGDENMMTDVNNELMRRGGEPGGLSVPDPQADTGQPDTGQPDTAPASGMDKKPSDFQQKYEADTQAKQEKQVLKKAQSDVTMKVRRLYDRMQTVKKLKPADVEYLQSVYDDPNASAKVKKEAYTTYKKYRDLNP